MRPKYQIFVSSTYEDLKLERDIVIKAMLEMGNIPVGMEMFSAGDEQQWELIKRQIDDCDYYIVIIAHRYGSTDGNISYTEKEYDYAVAKGIPALAFIIDDNVKWSKSNIDTDLAAQQGLASFKAKAKQKIVDFWKSRGDLHAKVAIALSKATTAYPRPGWVRATAAADPDVTNELSRLSRENAALRAASTDAEEKKRIRALEEQQKIINLLTRNATPLSFYFEGDAAFTPGPATSLFDVFHTLAPELMVEATSAGASTLLAVELRPGSLVPDKKLRPVWPIPANFVRRWLTDFHALGLIEQSAKKHQDNDRNEYWCITDLGRSVHIRMRIAALELGTKKPPKALISPGSPS